MTTSRMLGERRQRSLRSLADPMAFATTPADDGDTPPGGAIEVEARKRAPPERARLLIVDDDLDAAEILAELLETYGYRTAIAHDGPEALRVSAQFEPQIALLDIGLPVMDGYELAGRLREQLVDVKLIALTGYGQSADRERSRVAGFDSHLTKPVDLEMLARVLEGHSTREP